MYVVVASHFELTQKAFGDAEAWPKAAQRSQRPSDMDDLRCP
jgi:hypothetical protein